MSSIFRAQPGLTMTVPMLSFDVCQHIAAMAFPPTPLVEMRHVLGIPLDCDQLCRVASAICLEVVDDTDQAYEVLLGELLQMKYDLLPTTWEPLLRDDSNVEETLYLISFYENNSEDSVEECVRKCRTESLALRLWLKDRGVPEADDIRLMRRMFELD